MEWQPIETAPKDGSSILTVVAGYEPTVSEWHSIFGTERFCSNPEMFMSDDHFLEYFHKVEYSPTHWMPLPPAPEPTP